MRTARIVDANGTVTRDATEAEMERAWQQGALLWIDFDQLPSNDELAFVVDLLELGDGAVEHLTRSHRAARAARFRTYMLTVFYDVSLIEHSPDIERREIVLLFSERYLISVHDGLSPRLSAVSQELERSVRRYGIEIAVIVFSLLDLAADHYLAVVEQIRDQVELLENRVLQQEQQEAIGDLYLLRRQLIALRRVIAPEASLIGLHATPNPFIVNPEIEDGLLDVKHKLQYTVDEIDQDLSLLPDILTTFESLKSDNLNRILKLLTVWSIILTAVALLPTVMGISLQREPAVSPSLGYMISTALMVLLGAGIWYGFKRRGWVE